MPWRCVTDGVRKEKERLTAAIGRILNNHFFVTPENLWLITFRNTNDKKIRRWMRKTQVKEKMPWEGEFTLRSDPWAGLLASSGSFFPMVQEYKEKEFGKWKERYMGWGTRSDLGKAQWKRFGKLSTAFRN